MAGAHRLSAVGTISVGIVSTTMMWNTYRLIEGMDEDVAPKWNTYQKTAPIIAKQMTKAFRVNTKEGPVSGKAGDFLCIGVENEMWPIDQDIFHKTMKLVTKGVKR